MTRATHLALFCIAMPACRLGPLVDDEPGASANVLPSTATVGGEVHSRIVSQLPAGAVVSTPRHHTGVVVTEFGAADLRGEERDSDRGERPSHGTRVERARSKRKIFREAPT